jgi:LPS-assembly lipoprotein
MMRKLILSVAFLGLAACGFTPVYGSGGPGNGPIAVDEIEGRTGHFLRQELVRTVGRGVPGVVGDARLEIDLTERISRLAFAPDQAASRSDYLVAATFTLYGPNGDKLVVGAANEAASFNFADAAYADVAAQTAAQDRVASLLARTIHDKLVILAGKLKDGKPPVAGTPVQ